jgi:hypothetical protein
MNTFTFVTPEEILSNVLPQVDDTRMDFMPKGFYMSAIQKAMEDLALDTFFDERQEVFSFPGESLSLPMPEGAFNIRNIYVFHGDKCDIGSAQKVWWKRNYFTRGSGFMANDRGNNNNDPFYASHTVTKKGEDKSLIRYERTPGNIHFYNIQAGMIMFSSSCRSFPKVMIHYNGTGTPIGDAPIIPVIFRSAIEDHVTEFVLRVRMAKELSQVQKWRSLWQIYSQRKDDPYNGSWAKAETKAKSLHASQREELKEYLSRGGWLSGY